MHADYRLDLFMYESDSVSRGCCGILTDILGLNVARL